MTLTCVGSESRMTSSKAQYLFKIAECLISKKQTTIPRDPNVFERPYSKQHKAQYSSFERWLICGCENKSSSGSSDELHEQWLSYTQRL